MTIANPTAKGTFVHLTSPDGRRTIRSWVKVSIGDVWLPLSGGNPCGWDTILGEVEQAKGKSLCLDIEKPASAEALAKAEATIERVKKALESTDA